MLALNKVLLQVEVKTYIRFSQVQYTLSGAIFALFAKKTDVGELIPQ